jgi:hypothetical protein
MSRKGAYVGTIGSRLKPPLGEVGGGTTLDVHAVAQRNHNRLWTVSQRIWTYQEHLSCLILYQYGKRTNQLLAERARRRRIDKKQKRSVLVLVTGADERHRRPRF